MGCRLTNPMIQHKVLTLQLSGIHPGPHLLKKRGNDRRQDNSNINLLAVGIWCYRHPLKFQPHFHRHLAKKVRFVDTEADGDGSSIVTVGLPV